MKYFWNIIVILFIFLIQNSIVPYLKIFGIQPDILLIVIISFAFLEGPNYGSVNGFFGGLFQDLLSIKGFGIGMFSRTLVGYGSGMLEKTVFSENRMIVAPAIAAATIVSHILYGWLAFLFATEASVNLFSYTLPQALYNAVIGIPIFIVLEKFWGLPNVGQNKEVTIG